MKKLIVTIITIIACSVAMAEVQPKLKQLPEKHKSKDYKAYEKYLENEIKRFEQENKGTKPIDQVLDELGIYPDK